MKKILILLMLCCAATACVADTEIDTDEAEALVASPDAGEVTSNVGGGECLPEEAERGTCGGGGGGGPTGDQCTPGAPGCETCRPGYDPGCPGPGLPPARCANGYPANHPCCYTSTCRVMDPYPPYPPYNP